MLRTIRGRIVATGIAMILAGLLSSLVLMQQQSALLKRAHRNNVDIQLNILARNISAAVLFRDPAAADELLEALTEHHHVVAAQALDQAGEPLAEWQRETLPPADVEQFRRPVLVDGEVVGYVEAVVSNAGVNKATRALWRGALIVMILMSLIMAGGAWLIQRAVGRPLLALSRISDRVRTTGNYRLRAEIPRPPELAMLARNFNAMLETIEQRDAILERDVRLRTAELERLADQFRHRAFHDALTGLPNRALLAERLPSAIARANRNSCHFAVLLLDLDNFKNVNDSLGHDFGDELLKTVADRLTTALRGQDLICRMGGDEFLILLEDIRDPAALDRVAGSIQQALWRDTAVAGHRIEITGSIGGAIYPDHGTDISSLKRSADIAMYASKGRGKNQFTLFEKSMEQPTLYRMMVQNELRDSLHNGAIELWFQPKVAASAHAPPLVVGSEVLARWNHPTKGLLTPDHFIPYAEETGLMRELDYHILRHACAQASIWHRTLEQPMPVAVNLSGIHFRDHAIVEVLQEALTATALPASLLEVELTEAVLIADPSVAFEVLTAIRELGVSIALDDFGMGYSSLHYLRTLPIDTIKLDRSFVQSVLSNAVDQRLIEGILSLAAGLELTVVAEGVETIEQLQFLQRAGCHQMQGYLFLRPSPLEQFEEWLRRTGPAPDLGPVPAAQSVHVLTD
ncbi:MAG: EAL domain-containing protein [Spongiibacteraceae bacterium]|jgi:diguanylate cyclase (GGDEF)-like protein|nr:EAL domain-containing protein [Spongiibacteraceae bacterium]